MATTKHTHQVIFGRRVAGCPRCAELDNGAKPTTWGSTSPSDSASARSADMRAHFASAQHRDGGCGVACTYGDW